MKLSEIIADLQSKLALMGDADYSGYTVVPVDRVADYPFKKVETPAEVETSAEKAKTKEEPLSKQRLDICETCPEYKAIKIPYSDLFVHRCQKCGCVMELKSKIPMMQCPIGKW